MYIIIEKNLKNLHANIFGRVQVVTYRLGK